MNLEFADLNVVFVIISLSAVIAAFIKPAGRFLLLRLAGYALLLFILLRPVLETAAKSQSSPKINVYVDTSKSMSVEDRFSSSLEVAGELNSLLQPHADLEFYSFWRDSKNVDFQNLRSITPRGSETNLSSTLEGDTPQARVLITDGRHNSGPNPLALGELSAAGLFSVGIGTDYEVPDLAIRSPRIPPVVYRNQELSVEFVLTNAARNAIEVNVYLKEGRSITASKNINLAGREEIPLDITFTPEEAGLKEYVLEVEEIEGEINTANNRRSFHLNVGRDKIRVLYVTGQPSWEYSFLRRLLISDPHIELVSFLILRNPDNVTIVPESELSLIHFPAREMFTREIYNFDLLFYDNFSYRRFFPASYLEHIREFVDSGGGFIMLGGESSFGRGGYNGTALEEVLPVSMDSQTRWKREKIKPVVAGSLSHPLLSIAPDEESSRKIWSEIPELEGYDSSLKPRSGARVLLESEEGLPLVVAGTYGDGRVIAFNSNSTWRWAMGLSSQGKTPYYYNRFWENTLRYAIQTPEAEAVRIFPEKDALAVPRTVMAEIRVLDSAREPVSGAKVDVSLASPGGEEISLPAARPGESEGWYSVRLPVEQPGQHIIKAEARKDGRLLGRDQSEIKGIEIDREMSRLSINTDLLQQMASRSGGEYFDREDIDADKILSAAMEYTRSKAGEEYAWHWPPLFLLLLLIITIEWLLGG